MVYRATLLIAGFLAAFGAAAAGEKSADQCREENKHLTGDELQSAVMECLLKDTEPSKPEKPQQLRKKTYSAATAAEAARVKRVMADHLFDPYSAVLADLYAVRYQGVKDVTICGTVNAKNRYGGYVGKTPFALMQVGSDISFYLHGKDDFESMMIETLCRR